MLRNWRVSPFTLFLQSQVTSTFTSQDYITFAVTVVIYYRNSGDRCQIPSDLTELRHGSSHWSSGEITLYPVSISSLTKTPFSDLNWRIFFLDFLIISFHQIATPIIFPTCVFFFILSINFIGNWKCAEFDSSTNGLYPNLNYMFPRHIFFHVSF